MRTLAVIPARYNSVRFKGKVLKNLCGRPMIEHVYNAVRPAVDKVIVASDSKLVVGAVLAFGGNAVMTHAHCDNGTERAYLGYIEALSRWGAFDFVINVQGDEPLIRQDHINKVKSLYSPSAPYTMTTCAHVTKLDDDLNDRSNVFVVIDKMDNAMYFSRYPIPYSSHGLWRKEVTHYKHIGIYGFSPTALKSYVDTKPTKLQELESLEQLKWLENGYPIKCAVSELFTIGVDLPRDMLKVSHVIDFGRDEYIKQMSIL